MIDTNSMYGNVVEEKDTFTQLQQALKQKADTETKNKAAESVSLSPQLKASEIKLPDFPEEYIEATALETMYNMQEALQNILAAKRGTLAPSNKEDNHQNAKRSGYFMMSTVTELFELMEQLEKDSFEVTAEGKAEAVDALHFVYNQLLYLKYRPKMTLQKFYDIAVEDTKTGTIGSNSLQYLIGDFIVAVGDFYQNCASYKDWKTYDVWKEDPLKIQELGDKMFIKFMKIFVNLGMSPAEIYACYRSKNIENVNRQRLHGRYEK